MFIRVSKNGLLFTLVAILILTGRIATLTPESTHARPMFATFTVNLLTDAADVNPGDGICDTIAGGAADCTLRAAIQEANAVAGADIINFSVTGTINLTSALPAIISQVTITGTTTGVNNQPTVAVDANNLTIGLDFSSTAASSSSNSSLFGLAIRNADGGTTGTGIRIAPGAGGLAVTAVTIRGCWLGMNDAGTSGGAANQHDISILVDNADSNTIGGTAVADRNVVCASTVAGIRLTNGADSNVIAGNFIGLRPDNTTTIGNEIGIEITNNSNSNTMGGATSASRNIISGNQVGISMSTIAAPGSNTIANNYVGLDDDGSTDRGNNGAGISLNNVVGTTIGPGNASSGNTQEGMLLVGGTTGTVIKGNFIGTDAAGTLSVTNNNGGITLTGSSSNTIGGTTAADRNIISGHSSSDSGILMQAGSNNNQVLGNYIGTNAAGTASILNSFGIIIDNSTGNVIGSVGGGRNVISGNGDDGISINNVPVPGNNQVVGNYIGLAADGMTQLPNAGDGVFIGNPGVELTVVGPGNVISANNGDGVQLDVGAHNNTVKGNIIGLDAGGTIDLGNGQTGVQIGANAATGVNNADSNIIGGTTAADRNVISGNTLNGIIIQEGSSNNQILGNYIGTNAAGTAAVGNTENGILFVADAGTGNIVGSTAAGSGNVISGNTADGIQINAAIALNSSIKRNLIGLAAGATNAATSGIPNGGRGIQVFAAATELTIGRSEGAASPSGDGNLIAFNPLDGITINTTGNARVLMSENSIFSNGGLAIDLGANGVTPNNTDTVALTGPNGLQNFPVITSAATGSITIMGTLTSVASTSFTIEFFSDTACDPTSFGEARVFLGSTTVTTSAGGTATFNVTFSATPAPGNVVTATATRSVAAAIDVTSEVSQCRIVQLATAVNFAGFSARGYKSGVELQWSTGFETSNLGFNIYRDRSGERARLNSSLIAGSALTLGSDAKLLAGNSYSWWDAGNDGAGANYWVESMDLNGTSQWHGPFTAQSGDGLEPRSGPLTRAVMFSEINRTLSEGDGRHSVEPHAELPVLDSPLRTIQQDIAARQAVKIGINRAGWYRLSQAELLAAGLPGSANPRLLQLFVDGVQVPMIVTGELDGKFDPGDAVEFYGLPLDTPWTADRIYWLYEGRESGKRINKNALSGGSEAPPNYLATVERAERGVYFSNLRNGDAENFFGAVVRNTSTEQPLTLTAVDTGSGGQSTLEIALQGVTVQPHRVVVGLNGSAVTTLDFFGKELGTASVQIANNLIKEGHNVVTLQGEIGASDLSLVAYVRLTYARKYVADGNRLFMTAPGNTKVSISGFATNDIRIFDVTDANTTTELEGTVSGGNGNFKVDVTTGVGNTRTLIALSGNAAQSPTFTKTNATSKLASFAGRGNLFVITHSSLNDAIRPLLDQRRSEGWRIILADVEDVYDEYSFGHKTPYAIREWLSAMSRKSRGLNYLLLAGDGSYDPRNYLGFGNSDLVPSKSVDTASAETASDEWFADFDGDGVAEMAVGRLPARIPAEASRMVSKILTWDRTTSGQTATLVSDFNDTFNFLGTSNLIKSILPPSTAVDMIIEGETQDARARLLESLHKGPKLVNYAGHGSIDLWRGNILTSADAAALTNSNRFSVYLIMTCLNGYYQSPSLDSLAESLVKSPGGAAAVWASSGFTVPTDQEQLDAAMVSALYERAGITLGRAAHIAKSAISDPDVRKTWTLLGDPTMVWAR